MCIKAFIRINGIYSTGQHVIIDVDSIKNISSQKYNDGNEIYIKTTHGNFDTNIEEKNIYKAMKIASEIANKEKRFVVVSADNLKEFVE